MPFKKLRSLQEAEEAVWREPGDPGLWQAVRGVWKLSTRLFARQFPPGVYKHRSIEDANRQREAWESAAIRGRGE